MRVEDLLKKCIETGASDLHITVNAPPHLRIHGQLKPFKVPPLTPQDTYAMVKALLSETQFARLEKIGEVDLSISYSDSRFRLNAYHVKGNLACAIRRINSKILSFSELGLPQIMADLAKKQRGLILVTGPTGSGKSTTLAAMIDYINTRKSDHIITLEDPIEYYHEHKRCIVNQREIGEDTRSFAAALRAALRQDPDVIQVGEMRDLETIATALTAAETGHLVLSTLHTIGAASTVDRMVDVFPADQQEQIRYQLSMVLQGVISQQLIPTKDGKGRVAALEIMLAHSSINAQIREGKTHQINNSIMTNSKMGMVLMDDSIAQLIKDGIIDMDEGLTRAVDKDYLKKKLAFSE